MPEEVENTCCLLWKKKYSKLVEKYAKVEELKNKFRDCTSLVNEQYGVIEKENISLKQALDDYKVQVDRLKNEKEQEYATRVDLENQASILKDEIQSLHQNGKSDVNLQECLNSADKEINQLKKLHEKEINQLKKHHDKEKRRADLEKKNVEIEKNKANDALEKLEKEKKKVSEALKDADIERKICMENKLSIEELKAETEVLKSKLISEKSKSEVANKKIENEKHNAIRERQRADLAMSKSKELQKLADTNLKEAKFEKDRADDLDQKLKQERKKAEKLGEPCEYQCPNKLAEGRADICNAELGTLLSQGMEKMATEKYQILRREDKCVDSEMRKVEKQKKVAEEHKRKAIKEKHRADALSQKLKDCKMRLEELQIMQGLSRRTYDGCPIVIDKIDSLDRHKVKLLKKQLKLEKMLVKHSQEAMKMANLHNNMLRQELFDLKQRFNQFQLRLDKLDDSFVHGSEGIHELEKIGKRTFVREKVYPDGHQRRLVSGINSRLVPPYRDSNRKMKSSAINSSSASFSDLQLVGSQERGDISVTASSKAREDVSNLKPCFWSFSDKTIVSYAENDVPKAEKTIMSSIESNAHGRRVLHGEKRKILGAVESIEKLCSMGQSLHDRVSEKLSVLHDILHNDNDDHTEINLPENSQREEARPLKRRKTCCDGIEVVHPTNESKCIYSDIKEYNATLDTSPTCLTINNPDDALNDGINDILGSSECSQQEFDKIASSDYMKLLDLENAADEISFQIAIANPLSPTLPDINIKGFEAFEVDNTDILAEKSLIGTVSNARDIPASTSCFASIGVEEASLHLVQKNLDVEDLRDTNFYHIQTSCGKLGMPNVSASRDEDSHLFCESGITSIPGDIPIYVFTLEIKDSDSILRILQTITRCMPQCSLLHSADVFLQRNLPYLLKAENLSSKEKVCALFSVIMHLVAEMEIKDMSNVFDYDKVKSLGSFTKKICSVLSDMLRRTLMEYCDMLELLVLIENFLVQREVLVCRAVTDKSPVCSYKVNLVLNGTSVMLSEQAASLFQVVAGSCLLASLCSEVDNIGFLCEISCNLFAKKFDPAMVLAVLHSFAHSCDSKYFCLEQYTLAMTAIKSIVMVLEKQVLPTKSTSFFSSSVESPPNTWSCGTKCPFLDAAVSMEDVALLLLKNLQKYGQSVSWSLDWLEPVNLLVPSVFPAKEVSALEGASILAEESFCSCIDVFSLVEIIANFMKWDWTFDIVICQLLEFLETPESFSFAIIILLSQLGRLGVDINGYDDTKVEKLRDSLTVFFSRNSFRSLSISVQFATAAALLHLIPIEFEDIIANELPTTLSQQSIPADKIRKWWFCLSHEHQSSFKLYEASSQKTNLRIGFPQAFNAA